MPGKSNKKAAKPAAKKPVAKLAEKPSAMKSLKKAWGFAATPQKAEKLNGKNEKKKATEKTAATMPKIVAKDLMKGQKDKKATIKVEAKQSTAKASAQKGKKGKAAAPVVVPNATQTAEPGTPVCREVACELMATTGGYCRMHYIKNWKKVKRKEMILKERKLNHYIEELVSKYPDKYIEAIRQDLASEKDFAKVIADLEIEESVDDFETVETESAEEIVDNIKRDFEDEGESF